MKPEEVLPDDVDSRSIDGQVVRKGTVGAFIQSALALADPAIDAATREALRADLVALIPSMKALRVFEVFELRDPELRQFLTSQDSELADERPS